MRTMRIGGAERTKEIEELFRYSSPYRYALCDGGRRVAVWMRDEEHDWRHLLFADATTGEITEHIQDIASEYGGTIVLCRDGDRIVYQDENPQRWSYRDRIPDGWADTGPVPTGFDYYDEDIDDDVEVDVQSRLAASADGTTVVMVGTREEERERRTTRRTWAEVWTIGADDPVPVGAAFGDDIPHDPYVAVSAGERPLVAFLGDERMIVRDAATGGPVAELTVPKWTTDSDSLWFEGLTFSDNGTRLVGLFGGRVIVWDAIDWSAAAVTLAGDDGPKVAVSINGDRLATVDGDGTVRFFAAVTGEPGPVIRPPVKMETWDSPVDVAFSADGAMCLLGCSDGTVAVWDAE